MDDLDNQLDDTEDQDSASPDLSAALAPKPAAPKPPSILPAPGAPTYEYLQSMEQVAQKHAANAPKEVVSNLDDAIARAKEAYTQKTDRNDWLEIAQNLGNAITRFGAAQAGMRSSSPRGQDMGNLNLGPGIDYSKRNDRAHQEFLQDSEAATAIDNAARKRYTSAVAANDAPYKENTAILQKGAQYSNQAESEGRITKRDLDLAKIRDKERKDLDNSKEDLRNKSMQSHSLGDQLRREQSSYEKEKATTDKVVGELPNLLNSDDTGKEAEKLKAKYGDKLPGENWAGLQDKLNKATKPGMLGGLFGTNPDPEARQKVIDDEIANLNARLQKHHDLIDSLQQKRDSLFEGGAPSPSLDSNAMPQAGSAPTPSAPPPSDNGMVTVITSDGKSGKIPAANVGKFLKDNPGSSRK